MRRSNFAAFVAVGVTTVLAMAGSGGGPAEALPGENGKIAYTHSDGESTDIYVMNADGTDQVNLTNHPADDIAAAWSPDGSKIAFASTRDGDDLEIYVMNADGSDPRQLTDNDALDCCARWSPDGSQLVFHSDLTGDLDVFVMRADGSGQTNLTNAPSFDAYADWSPDGAQIAFQSDRSGVAQAFLIDATGGVATQLSEGEAWEPMWSPDGARILFTQYLGNRPDGTSVFDIHIMNADGTEQRSLTSAALVDGVSYGNASWSPDGASVLYSSGTSDAGGIFVMSPDGSGRTALIEGAIAADGSNYDADWQPVPPGGGQPPPAVDDDGGNTTMWVVLAIAGGAAVVALAGGVVALRMRRR